MQNYFNGLSILSLSKEEKNGRAFKILQEVISTHCICEHCLEESDDVFAHTRGRNKCGVHGYELTMCDSCSHNSFICPGCYVKCCPQYIYPEFCFPALGENMHLCMDCCEKEIQRRALNVLLLGHEKDEDSPFHKDYLPKDVFKIIIRMTNFIRPFWWFHKDIMDILSVASETDLDKLCRLEPLLLKLGSDVGKIRVGRKEMPLLHLFIKGCNTPRSVVLLKYMKGADPLDGKGRDALQVYAKQYKYIGSFFIEMLKSGISLEKFNLIKHDKRELNKSYYGNEDVINALFQHVKGIKDIKKRKVEEE